MARSVRSCLAEALGDLEEEELETFKANLKEYRVKPGFSNILRGSLQKAGAHKLSDLLISYYCQDYAVEVAAAVLLESNCRPQAERLLRDTGRDARNAAQEPVLQLSTHPGQAEVQAPEMHFIERHRDALIQRTATVEEILDQLYGVLLSNEQYQEIMIKGTEQAKMRALFNLVPGWDRHGKDLLYEVLKQKRKFLIEDLERQ